LELRQLRSLGGNLAAVGLRERQMASGSPTVRTRASRFVRVAERLVVAIAVSGCAAPGESPEDAVDAFAEDALVSGRVIENNTSCVVDAVCFLRLAFADTSVAALYGTGERPAPPCSLTREVSDVAFGVQRGELVSVVISRCAGEGHYIRQLVRAAS